LRFLISEVPLKSVRTDPQNIDDSIASAYRGTSLTRNSLPLGTYSSICLGPYDGPREGEGFL